MARPQLLSKSKYMGGVQCLRYAWLLFNDPNKIPATDASTQNLFDEGHRLGALAHELFPDGIDLDTSGFSDSLARTRGLLNTNMRQTLFEPGFLSEPLFSRLDILNPVDSDEWDIIEVKGSTKVKPEHIKDVAFQKFCVERCGLNIRRCHLLHVNNQYIRQGQIEPEKLLVSEDVTELVNSESLGIEDRIEAMLKVVSSDQCPDMHIGSWCNDPYSCPVTWCRESLPEHHVFELYRGGKTSSQLYDQGIQRICDIPESYDLSGPQQIQKACILSDQPHIEKDAVRKFVDGLQYPLHYLDFETIAPMIPMYDGTRPYEKIPFQFSLHFVEKEGADTKHFSFLADGNGDPRPAFLSALKSVMRDSGSVVVYNQTFEKGMLQALAEAFPENTAWISNTLGRVVDLIVPFRKFHYYHPAQEGSASLKHVLPAVTGKSYEGMSIAKGDDASLAFLKIADPQVADEEKAKLRADLEQYCGLDTEGMVWIMDNLRELF